MSLQVVQPRIRGFISVSAHPEGCAENVRRQVAVARAGLGEARARGALGPTLVVGASTGYGLATALSACFALDAPVLGVCFEREPDEERTATAGWYNLAEAHRLASEEGRHLETINGDAFSDEVKAQAVEALLERFGPVELLVYSLAAPRRVDPEGRRWESVLKPIGAPYLGKTMDPRTGALVESALEPATPEEIEGAVKVMGGEDWALWVERLRASGLLAPGFRTVAYSYVGPEITRAVYRDGTIGRAKLHLEATARELSERLASMGGRAWVSVNKGVVTQASAAIPGMSLYISILQRVMREQGTHEGTIEQIVRLFRDHLGPGVEPSVDGEGLIRLDDRELAASVQDRVRAAWDELDTSSAGALEDYASYQREFQQLFGFDVEGVDYDAPTEVMRPLG